MTNEIVKLFEIRRFFASADCNPADSEQEVLIHKSTQPITL